MNALVDRWFRKIESFGTKDIVTFKVFILKKKKNKNRQNRSNLNPASVYVHNSSSV